MSSIARLRAAAGPAWGCGFSDATPPPSIRGVSFAQPIRRVFGTLLFHARDHVTMPPPGDVRPARLDRTARPGLARTLRADCGCRRLCVHAAQPPAILTIRRYLSLVFATLVTLLLVLAIWS